MKKIFVKYFIFILLLTLNCFSMENEKSPKREFRAVWIASVGNINWPSKQGLTIEEQKKEYIDMLNEIKALKMNAVIVQVRPVADRFYKSPSDEPWSKYLTGEAGKDPGYDPLKFLVDEAHKRNLEFHAWFNPYRVTFTKGEKLPKNHPALKYKDWTVNYDGKLYYNPGVPAARNFTEKVILDVVKNYDIDAVHMDDYFYPYPARDKKKKDIPFPDREAYKKYGKGLTLDAWRRKNVDIFVESLAKNIKKTKPYVKFGISPFGVWRNISDDSTGSNTKAGVTNYDTLYADTRKWIKKGWIDYIVPQIYWNFDFKVAPYATLVDWWQEEVSGSKTNLYIGHAAYRLGSNEAWKNEDELLNQINYNRDNGRALGSAYFGLDKILNNSTNIKENLKGKSYKNIALPPKTPWIDEVAPSPVTNFKLNKVEDGVELTWDDFPKNYVTYYAIYRSETPKIDVTDSRYLLETIRRDGENKFVDRDVTDGKSYFYLVTAVDRVHNESKASQPKKIFLKK